MTKQQKSPKGQAKMPERKVQNIVLSENRTAKYKIVKIQQNAVIRKEKADTASTSAQSQKRADKKPEDMQKAVNMSGKSQRRNTFASSSNKTTTPEENSGDKYKDLAKINLAKTSDANDKAAINKRAEDTNYRVQNASIVQAIQRKSNHENEVKSYTLNNTQDMAKTSRYKAKAEEITAKMKADVNKMRSETSSLENGMRNFAISKAKDSKRIVHFKKGNVDSKRFNKAVNNTIKKEITNNPDYKKFKGKAAVHYKKMNKLEKKQKKIDNKLEKAEKKADRNEKILEAGKTAAAMLTNPKQAVKQIVEDKIRKTALGNSALNAKDDLQMLSNAAEANSLSEGTANVVMAMPEKYIKNTVKNTVTKTLTGRSKADGLAKKKKKVDRKYGAEAAKAGRAERKAQKAKESVLRKSKIKFYKEEKGLIKSSSITKNIKQSIKNISANICKLAINAGGKAIVAVISAVGPMILMFLIIIMVISALFAWVTPHKEYYFDNEAIAWQSEMVENNEEILKGYIRHIQNYFDEKQLEILEVVDINYDGFTPDEYDYKYQYIWNLYKYGNKWIKLSNDCDCEHIIAMAAVKKWQEIEADGFDSSTYKFEITDEDLDYCINNLFEFYYSYRSGPCDYQNCHLYYEWKDGRRVEVYTCNRASTHKHIIGQVTNFELIGGYELALNKILKTPIRADYDSDEAYNEAQKKYETDKEIYEIYVEYVYNELGTSTKIPDYENDIEAQTRLSRMHQLKRPTNPPTNVNVSVRKKKVDAPPGYYNYSSGVFVDKLEHYFLDISWNAPAPEEYAEGKPVEIQGYNIYAYKRNTGEKKYLGCVTGTIAYDIDYGPGDWDEGIYVDSESNKVEATGKAYVDIVVEAYSFGGSGPESDPVYVVLR